MIIMIIMIIMIMIPILVVLLLKVIEHGVDVHRLQQPVPSLLEHIGEI